MSRVRRRRYRARIGAPVSQYEKDLMARIQALNRRRFERDGPISMAEKIRLRQEVGELGNERLRLWRERTGRQPENGDLT